MRLLFLGVFFFSLSTAANRSEVAKKNKKTYYYKVIDSLPEGGEVVVTDYTRSYGGVFRGFLDKLDGEGYFYFRAEHLAKALKKEPKVILKSANKLKGKTIKLKSKLLLVASPPKAELEDVEL